MEIGYGKTIKNSEILPDKFSVQRLSDEFKIKNIRKSRSILTSLRECGFLNSKYISKENDIFFWINDKGIAKYFEQYFVYKRKEQVKDKISAILKLLFYGISTIGIITSIIHNIYSTRTILDKIESKEIHGIVKQFERDFVKTDSLKITQIDNKNEK